jgi:phage tail P2-like protein
MVVGMSDESLLPPNAATQEITLESVIEPGTDLPIPIRDLWKPDTCPASLLPWLAWALSVDEWDSDWPEAIKRSVIAQSVSIHRKKGTVHAVRRALEILGVQVELREWFEQNAAPHTFSLTAWAGENFQAEGEPLLTPQYYDALKRAVDAVKPVRSHYNFKVGARFFRDLGLLTTLGSTLSLRRNAEAIQAPIAAAIGFTSGAAALPMNLMRRWVQPASLGNLQLAATMTVVTQRAVTHVRVSMETQ